MPQIDYSKCIIYRIVCKDLDVKNSYIGSTTDLRRRRFRHKQQSIEFPARRIYKCIDDNGGWDNWHFIIVEQQPVENKFEMLKRERFYMEYNKCDLNYNKPYRK